MTTMTHRERVTLPICPPWCDGHDGIGYQSWEEGDGGAQQREHGTESVVVGNGLASISVGICQAEDGLGRMSAPVVSLYVERDARDLTPADARTLAAALVEAAERAEAGR